MSAWDHFTYHWWKIRILLFLLIVAGAAYAAFQWIKAKNESRFAHWPVTEAKIVESRILETGVSDEHSIRHKLFFDLEVVYEQNGRKLPGQIVVTGATRLQYESSFSKGKDINVRVDPDSPEEIAFFWKDQPGLRSKDSGGSLP